MASEICAPEVETSTTGPDPITHTMTGHMHKPRITVDNYNCRVYPVEVQSLLQNDINFSATYQVLKLLPPDCGLFLKHRVCKYIESPIDNLQYILHWSEVRRGGGLVLHALKSRVHSTGPGYLAGQDDQLGLVAVNPLEVSLRFYLSLVELGDVIDCLGQEGG